MNPLAAASIFFGLMLIATRAPFIFAPQAARKFWLRQLASPARVRLMGLFTAAIGAAMVMAAQGSYRLEVLVVLGTGWGLILLAVFVLLIFASAFSAIARDVFGAIEDPFLRGMGAIATLVGAMFIYMGVMELR